MIRKGTVDEIHEVISLIPEFVDPYSKEAFENRLSGGNSLVLIAEKEHKPVGFKCGYEKNSTVFYSWMGGVLPEYRRKGVAKDLLNRMESWCRIKGYEKLLLKTLNRHKNMLLFSIKNDFNILEVETSNKDPQLRIWLAKNL